MSVQSRSLGYVSLAFLNISAIISLRHLPALATFGLWSILFYVLGAIVFLIPVALICAELATTWPQRGGLYNWVYLSMGPLPAFFAVWWSWMAAIVTILLNLTFLSVTLSYAFPLYAQKHLLFYLCTTLSGLWGLTFINIFGIHFSALLSSASLILGTLLPVCGIILLACVGLFTGQSDFSKLNLIDYQNQFYSIETFFFFSNVVVGYAGIELAAFHASDARNPQKDYSRAIFLSVIAIISLYVIGTLGLVLVLPKGDIDRIGGLVQFFHTFFQDWQLNRLSQGISLILAIGSLGATNTWLISPAKGIFAAMEHYAFPRWMTYKNQYDVPVPLLIVQSVVCTAILIFMVFFHSIDRCFWLLTALTTQFSLFVYMMMIISIVILRKKEPAVYRPFKIPDSFLSFLSVSTFLVCTGVFFSTLIPLESMLLGDFLKYEAIFVIGWIVMSLPPFLFRKN